VGIVRLPLVRQWAADNDRPYMYAAQGRGSVDAVDDQLFEDDYARAEGRKSCSVMIDLSKCYERVGHAVIVKAAVALNYPLRILAVTMALYSGSRRIKLEHAYTAASSCSGHAAGDTYATFLLRAVVIFIIDPIARDSRWLGSGLSPSSSEFTWTISRFRSLAQQRMSSKRC
jgi:hypothetical protein